MVFDYSSLCLQIYNGLPSFFFFLDNERVNMLCLQYSTIESVSAFFYAYVKECLTATSLHFTVYPTQKSDGTLVNALRNCSLSRSLPGIMIKGLLCL